jgi:hypothetical protein
VGGGIHARARPRKSAIFALQDGKNPRFASPRTRPEKPEKAGGGGAVFFYYHPPSSRAF